MGSFYDTFEEMMNNDSCTHLKAVADAVKNSYHVIAAYYVTCIAEEAFKRKAIDAHCQICKATNKRIHACLECAFFGCFDLSQLEQENDRISHMKYHAIKYNHYFAVNINHGYLFCFKCGDYIYDETFEDIINDYKVESRKINGSPFNLPWMPKAKEISLLKDKIKKISDRSYIGLRGIVNIGYSCYINCIIQVLMHYPLLRDFFFTDQHKCFRKDSDSCLMCNLFVLFQEFYSGITIPYDPINFFEALQNFCASTLGQEPQDCYETFLEVVAGLLSSCQEKHETTNCSCIIHQMFFGVNEISRECSQCKASAIIHIDHFLDVLLDLKGKDDSLVEMLKRKFLLPELLSDYTCSTCKEINTTYSYQTLQKLPSVICFRMNAFKCDVKTQRIKKKSTAFVFEEWIDMSDFFNLKGDIKLSNGSHISNSYAIANRYYLFAVIFHNGDLEHGHFCAYVKQRKNQWFLCDDAKIYKRRLEEVLGCDPFLLFYGKQL